MMRWLLLSVLTGVTAVGLITALAAPASTDAMRLVGTTGPGRTITLTRAGKTFDYLKRGRYAITIRDRSAKHGFWYSMHLDTGVHTPTKTITTARFVGSRTVTVTLQPGLFYYSCPVHWRVGMHGRQFRVE